jgi:hypothetical protein
MISLFCGHGALRSGSHLGVIARLDRAIKSSPAGGYWIARANPANDSTQDRPT